MSARATSILRHFHALVTGRARKARPPKLRRLLELDRVRTVLSCVILICLLTLIVVGSRSSTTLLRPIDPKSQVGFFEHPALAAPSPLGRR